MLCWIVVVALVVALGWSLLPIYIKDSLKRKIRDWFKR